MHFQIYKLNFFLCRASVLSIPFQVPAEYKGMYSTSPETPKYLRFLNTTQISCGIFAIRAVKGSSELAPPNCWPALEEGIYSLSYRSPYWLTQSYLHPLSKEYLLICVTPFATEDACLQEHNFFFFLPSSSLLAITLFITVCCHGNYYSHNQNLVWGPKRRKQGEEWKHVRGSERALSLIRQQIKL